MMQASLVWIKLHYDQEDSWIVYVNEWQLSTQSKRYKNMVNVIMLIEQVNPQDQSKGTACLDLTEMLNELQFWRQNVVAPTDHRCRTPYLSLGGTAM